MNAPQTADELYAAINTLFNRMEDSTKAYEVMMNGEKVWHTTYHVGWDGFIPEEADPYNNPSVERSVASQRAAVELIWSDVQKIKLEGKGQVIWRRNPEVEKLPYPSIYMRCAFI